MLRQLAWLRQNRYQSFISPSTAWPPYSEQTFRNVNYVPGGFFVVLPCADEPHQVELLKQFQQEGLKCEPKMC